MSGCRLVIFTRYPTPGAAKTRLIPALGAEGAARLHRRLTERTVAVARAAGLPFELRTTGAAPSAFIEWLGATAVVDQGPGGLGERLFAAATPYPVIFVGTDLPDLTADHLLDAAAALADFRPVIGPAQDGGYWLLGLETAVPDVFDDVDWSTDAVFAQTMARFAAAGLTPLLLERLADLDRPEDLARWPHLLV